jgi:hypothetical protein
MRSACNGLSVEVGALRLLTNSISTEQKRTEVVNLLQSWIDEEDGSEQQETGQYLIHALDEDRITDRQLFPVELKGITYNSDQIPPLPPKTPTP